MTTIINAIPEYVLTVVISAVFIFAIRYVHTYVHSKALHAKTAQSKELWSFMDQVASTAVASLVSADKTGDQKFTAATAIVQDALTKQGFTTVDIKAIEAAVQAAYEKSPLTPAVVQKDPVKQAIKTAPNRANQTLLTTGHEEAKG
ncbi:MAG: phage holin, LLH family [[Lactobacillus] timonensis]|nr:phage holin, LLH family [[Lactobacillus] timonensis]MCI1957354.1 phage holin, LLH family [[Lactobacillus] timonensis]MCI1970452.1 phage holin, LLH family [[Lactobacillus] timonensis]